MPSEIENLIFITGNPQKAAYLAKWLNVDIPHQKVALEELQSLDLAAVVTHKAKSAYDIIKKPVLVEDVALTFHALGRLPGTLVKWFLEEIGTEGLCRMMQPFDEKTATASIMYGLFDGKELHTFEGHVKGTVAPEPRFSEASSWKMSTSWNSVFIPNGQSSQPKTYGEMTDEELLPFSHRGQAIAKLRQYLGGEPQRSGRIPRETL